MQIPLYSFIHLSRKVCEAYKRQIWRSQPPHEVKATFLQPQKENSSGKFKEVRHCYHQPIRKSHSYEEHGHFNHVHDKINITQSSSLNNLIPGDCLKNGSSMTTVANLNMTMVPSKMVCKHSSQVKKLQRQYDTITIPSH